MQGSHKMVTETDCAKEVGLQYTIDERDLVVDLKALIKDYYAATINADEHSLKLGFNNGQKFSIKITEIK